MSTLLERLREALAGDYSVEGELASGGMGIVFLGRDVALDRPVAIKIIRPDLATATAAERFVREARVLASLSHPNIVPVHRAGESRGFYYYVMDYLEADTLDDRLARGPLSAAEAIQLGRDLLAALEAVHKRGIVHRDIKPANIFLVEGRALLADFGLAKPTTEPGAPLTVPGHTVGTPGYMPPEQMSGGEVTHSTDICAVGLVLYEALTGRQWPFAVQASRVDWMGVPRALVPVLARALAWAPGDRWQDAAEFRRALERAGAVAPPLLRAIRWTAVGLAAVVAGALAVKAPAWFRFGSAEPAGAVHIDIPRFAQTGASDRPWLGDSLASALVRSLGANTDFTVYGPGDEARDRDHAPTLTLGGQLEVGADGVVRVEMRARPPSGRGNDLFDTWSGPALPLAQLADTLARHFLLKIWSREQSPVAAELPLRAVPQSGQGMAAFVAAQLLYAQARWGDAYAAYHAALARDSTCLLCAWRITDVERWLGLEHDSNLTRRYRAHIDSFPPNYQSLIRASFADPRARLDTMSALTQRAREWFHAWFLYGDEIFHRGPLVGMARSLSVEPLRIAALRQPEFAPAWEHLAWVLTAEGDSAGAAEALRQYVRTSAESDPTSIAMQALLSSGFHWRFLSADSAARFMTGTLARPEVLQLADLGAGPRFLMAFDAPQGAVWLGAELARRRSRPDAQRSGLIAEVVGRVALGQPVAALETAGRLRDRFPSPEHGLFRAQLQGALFLLDWGDVASAWPELKRALAAYGDREATPPHTRHRAAWMLALLAGRAGEDADARASRALLEDEPAPRPFQTLLAADQLARGPGPDRWQRAVLRSEPLTALDSAGQAGDPFYRTVLHMLRATWQERRGSLDRAVAELRWHENDDVVRYPTGDPQAADVDWAFGTLARWRHATMLDRSGERGAETCRNYEAVARLWARGESRFRARADSARARLALLGCQQPR